MPVNMIIFSSIDGEPITAMPSTPWIVKHFEKRQFVRLAVPTPPRTINICDGFPSGSLRIVDLCGLPLRIGGATAWHAQTYDEESALLLKAVFLPGQRSTLTDRERAAFAAGFIFAWKELR